MYVCMYVCLYVNVNVHASLFLDDVCMYMEGRGVIMRLSPAAMSQHGSVVPDRLPWPESGSWNYRAPVDMACSWNLGWGGLHLLLYAVQTTVGP